MSLEERRALLELVASHGDMRLASERLGISVHDLSVELLDSAELGSIVVASIKLQLLDLISNTRIALIASLDDMAPRDLARSLFEILSSFSALDQTAPPSTNFSQAFNNDTSTARERVLSKFADYASAGTGKVG